MAAHRRPTARRRTPTCCPLFGARALPHLRRAAESVEAAFAERQDARTPARRRGNRGNAPIDEEVLCRAVLSGFPDRVAQRRAEHGDALLLAAGTGARLSPASGVRNAAWLVALDVRGIEGREAVVQLASGVEREWLAPTHTERRVWVDDTGRLRAVRVRRYDALTLQEHPMRCRPRTAPCSCAPGRTRHAAPGSNRCWRDSLSRASNSTSPHVLAAAAADVTRLDQIDLEGALPWDIRQRLLTDAPSRLPLPSGRTAALVYDHGRVVRAAVKLQELFGLAETPRVGPRRDPVVFELLAPNGRPVQTTQDLRSFWTTTYAEVRRELRARYPRHPWPDDPWTATPTHRVRPRTSGPDF